MYVAINISKVTLTTHAVQLEQKLEQFRNIATEVRLIPDGSKNSMGRTFQLEIDTDKTNACGLLTFNISLKSHIRVSFASAITIPF